MLRRMWIIIQKEIVDNMRDRRSVGNALFAVLLNPLLYVVLFGFLNRTFSEQAERALALPVVGATNAPNLIQFLDQNNIDIVDAPEDAEAAVRRGDLDVVLVIPDDFGEQFRDGRPAQVQLLIDDSSQSSSVPSSRVQSLINQYSSQIGNLRLLARGKDRVEVDLAGGPHPGDQRACPGTRAAVFGICGGCGDGWCRVV